MRIENRLAQRAEVSLARAAPGVRTTTIYVFSDQRLHTHIIILPVGCHAQTAHPPKETLSIIDVRACLNTNVVYYIKSQNERRSTIEARGWQMASNGFFLNKVKPEPSDMSTSSVPTRSQSKHWIMVPNARLATCMPRFSAGHRRLPMPNDMAILPA